MTLDELTASARALSPVPADAALQYADASDAMVRLVDSAMEAREDIGILIGGRPLEMMFANHAHHAAFMADVFSLGQYELLARTLPWVYRSYRGQGFSYDYFPVELAAWIRAVRTCLAPTHGGEIQAIYGWMLEHHSDVVFLARQLRRDGASVRPAGSDRWTEMRQRYLLALVAGASTEALDIARTVTTPGDLESFFLFVVQPAMYEIGERWEVGELSVAHEHLASAITSRVIAGLPTAWNTQKPWRGSAVITTAPNEFHELGAWMLSDLLEIDGWDVSYLGANTPREALVSMIRDRTPALLALSVTMPFNLDKTRATIAAVREHVASWTGRILVGGQAFNLQHDLWKAVGADAWALDAHDAVIQARAFGRPARS